MTEYKSWGFFWRRKEEKKKTRWKWGKNEEWEEDKGSSIRKDRLRKNKCTDGMLPFYVLVTLPGVKVRGKERMGPWCSQGCGEIHSHDPYISVKRGRALKHFYFSSWTSGEHGLQPLKGNEKKAAAFQEAGRSSAMHDPWGSALVLSICLRPTSSSFRAFPQSLKQRHQWPTRTQVAGVQKPNH